MKCYSIAALIEMYFSYCRFQSGGHGERGGFLERFRDRHC